MTRLECFHVKRFTDIDREPRSLRLCEANFPGTHHTVGVRGQTVMHTAEAVDYF